MKRILSASALLAYVQLAAQAETIVAKGKIWTGTETGTIEYGLSSSKIGEIQRIGGPDTDIPEDATVIGASGSWVTPGYHCALLSPRNC